MAIACMNATIAEVGLLEPSVLLERGRLAMIGTFDSWTLSNKTFTCHCSSPYHSDSYLRLWFVRILLCEPWKPSFTCWSVGSCKPSMFGNGWARRAWLSGMMLSFNHPVQAALWWSCRHHVLDNFVERCLSRLLLRRLLHPSEQDICLVYLVEAFDQIVVSVYFSCWSPGSVATIEFDQVQLTCSKSFCESYLFGRRGWNGQCAPGLYDTRGAFCSFFPLFVHYWIWTSAQLVFKWNHQHQAS